MRIICNVVLFYNNHVLNKQKQKGLNGLLESKGAALALLISACHWCLQDEQFFAPIRKIVMKYLNKLKYWSLFLLPYFTSKVCDFILVGQNYCPLLYENILGKQLDLETWHAHTNFQNNNNNNKQLLVINFGQSLFPVINLKFKLLFYDLYLWSFIWHILS